MSYSRHTTVCARYHLSQGRPCACDLNKRAVVIPDLTPTVRHRIKRYTHPPTDAELEGASEIHRVPDGSGWSWDVVWTVETP